MKLTGIRYLGRFKNRSTGKEVNIHKGRRAGRSVDVIFYYVMKEGRRQLISDREFYDEWERVTP